MLLSWGRSVYIFCFFVQCLFEHILHLTSSTDLSNSLLLFPIVDAVSKEALCNDKSEAKYYYSAGTDLSRWVIFLESGGGCWSVEDCNTRFETSPELMTSDLLPPSTEGRDILSRDREENPYWDYEHVLIPYCSSDLWLGMKSTTGDFHWHNDPTTNDFTFRGKTIFEAIIEDLMPLGLRNATHLLLAGSSAGGIGALNHGQWLRSRFTDVQLDLLVDSSWLIDFEGNLAKRLTQELEQMTDYRLSPACSDTVMFNYPCCVSAQCLLFSSYLPSDSRVFFIHSLYDIYMFRDTLQRLEESETSGGQDVVRLINNYGGWMNATHQMMKGLHHVSYFIPSCLQHVYLAVSSLWEEGQVLHNQAGDVYQADSLRFKHIVQSDYWHHLFVNNMSLNAALHWWQSSNRSRRIEIIDVCQGAQCNPTCPDQFEAIGVANSWPDGLQLAVSIIAITTSSLCVLIKLLLTWCHKRLEFKQLEYLVNRKQAVSRLPECGIGVSIACLHLTYAIETNTKDRHWTEQKKNGECVRTGLSDDSNIINNVSTYFNPGQLVAIMGPSGSGKTTLLDLLTQRRQQKGADGSLVVQHTMTRAVTSMTHLVYCCVQGEVFVNGMHFDTVRDWFVQNTGYVLQLATPYYDELTVRQTLTYTALMKLPRSMSLQTKFDRIEQVIAEVP